MKQSFWPDHVSFQTLEGMCVSLIEGKEDQNTLTCYRVCVYMKAAALLCRLPKKDRSVPLRRHLEQSKKHYEHEIHRALSEIDYLAPPSLLLLQAFLSAVCRSAFLRSTILTLILIYSLPGTIHAESR